VPNAVARAGEPTTPDASLDAATALLAHVRGALAGYMLPKRLTALGELPRLGSGTVDRAALAALARKAP
jgi:acyl-CoA synthetase (AMP-forming)/AMP-acid ligase II